MLRPRYKPDWVPSWEGTDTPYWSCEDGHENMYDQTLDATRISDGAMVLLKRVSTSIHPYEIEIGQFFSSEPLASNAQNHCVPIYDVLRVPDNEDIALLVMPLLRGYDDPPMQTMGEAVEFFRQIFEGLQFMHENHVAHRDCMNLNVMMDPKPLYPKMFHPLIQFVAQNYKGTAKHYTRTGCPTKYYFIDFGLSRRFHPDGGPPREYPIFGGDKTVPEFRNSDEPCDPFPTDIYYLGNLIREDFLQRFHGVEFMLPLVNDMVQDEPESRPTIHQIVSRFAEIQNSLGYWQLRSRLVGLNEPLVVRIFLGIRQFFRTVGYILTWRSPIPSP
ncbi:predicted protein [Sparassis crispa]|uniref:Protein kinase domain-containing protein n=1 Tax=Sparassis crispa TaxID=139825 RepID=A0A401GEI7_9APHY|nr:predicted protein [Sparassis crispa]GBE80577.1 predicted protein [Sparassis crispa]